LFRAGAGPERKKHHENFAELPPTHEKVSHVLGFLKRPTADRNDQREIDG
jgi:hypothetical protein